MIEKSVEHGNSDGCLTDWANTDRQFAKDTVRGSGESRER